MNGYFIPSDITKNDLYNSEILDNPSVIQFYHRLSAYILVIFLIILNIKFFYKQDRNYSNSYT